MRISQFCNADKNKSNMAEDELDRGPLKKGSKHQIRIDNILPDVIIATLKHGRKTFHGALFNTNKENMCYGIQGKRTALKDLCKSTRSDETVSLKPVAPEEDLKCDLSGLMKRQSYNVDKDAVDPKWLVTPKRDINRPLISKSVNKMRLRPRQVLCSECKKGLHSNTKGEKDVPKDKVPPKETIPNGKRKSGDQVEEPLVKKVKSSHTNKSSPAIRISFASPKGVGTVLKIPPRPSTPNPSDSDLSQDNSEITESSTPNHQVEYKNPPITMKRDRIRKRQGPTIINLKVRKTQDSSPNNKADKVQILHKKTDRKAKHRSKKKDNSKSKKKSKERSSTKENISSTLKNNNSKSVQSSQHSSPPCEQGNNDPSLRCKVVLEKLDKHSYSNSSNSSLNNMGENSKCDTDVVGYKFVKSTSCIVKNEFPDENHSQANESNHKTEEGKDYDYQNYFEDISDSDSDCLQIDETGISNSNSANFNDENEEPVKPLTMKIQTREVIKCELEDGRTFHEDDVVWGKITGFPWWPGRITSLYESLKDFGTIIAQNAHVSWFGSSTRSVMACSELYPFLEYYKDKFSKKKKGTYKIAIKQAMLIVHGSSDSIEADSSNTCNSTPASHVSEEESLPPECEAEVALMDVTSTISNDNLAALVADNSPATHSVMDSPLHREPDVADVAVDHNHHMATTAAVPTETPHSIVACNSSTNMPSIALTCDDSQEVPNINENLEIIHHASSEPHSEIYDDDVNFEIDELNCVAPSDVFRTVEFSRKKNYEEDSEIEEGEILSDSND